MFEIANLAEVQRGIAEFMKAAEQTAVNTYRGLAAFAFSYVVEETPQYTGESVANWRFSVGTPVYSPQSGIKYERGLMRQKYKGLPVYQKQGFTGGDANAAPVGQGGNPQAMRIARGSLRAGYRQVKSLDDVIFITNATAFGKGGKTVGDFENSPGWLREVNKPGRMLGRARDYIMDNFSTINAQNLSRLMVMPA